MGHIRIATRQSPLALWQAQHIAKQLSAHWPNLQVELLPMTTSGDRFLTQALQASGGKGLFVKELEDALLNNRADIAVHSTKDVPAELPEGLILPVFCQRDNPFDVLISRDRKTLAQLPDNAVIGTVSLRRQAQLLAGYPHLHMRPLRGNIQTRIKKLYEEDLDAIVLAAAGIERMRLEDHIAERFSPPFMVPACAQGALSIECREDDQQTQAYIAPLHDPETAVCIQAERHVNALLGGNCHVPLAMYAWLEDYVKEDVPMLNLIAKVMSADGKTILLTQRSELIKNTYRLAEMCVQDLLQQGAADLLK